jgi:hypothetical protein
VAKPEGIVDYYAVMNLPYTADLAGVDNAYARLSDELAALGKVDASATEALRRLNEAYGVLSRPEKRRKYDEVFLAEWRMQQEKAARGAFRRNIIMQWMVIGVLALILAGQTAALAYIGRSELSTLLDRMPF